MIITIQEYSRMSQKTPYPISGEVMRRRVRKGLILLSAIPRTARMGIDIDKYPFSENGRRKAGRPKGVKNKLK